LAALGVSMGGAAALIGGPIRTDALIVESVFPDLAPSLSNRLALEIGEAVRAATPILLLALRVAAGIDRRRVRPIEAIGHFHAPILVLTGAEDVKTTREESRALFARANPPKFYWERPAQGTSISLTPAAKPTGSACSDFWLQLCALAAFPRGDCRPIIERAV
jgi:hypothetical protein